MGSGTNPCLHDFQLLPLAEHLPAGVPRLFRWHIPVPAEPSPFLEYAADRLNEFDAVIVSTQPYADRLREAGVRVPIHARYPYLDEARRRVVTIDNVRAFNARWRLAEDDVVFLVVARLDPIKSQDVAIRALARIARVCPNAKLVLIGGGGFSGGRRGSLGLPQAATWRDTLDALARRSGASDRVVFTGNITDKELEVAYERSRAVLVPSRIEGFGLVAVEGWIHGRPVLVSRGAGVSDLTRDGRNGYAFDPDDAETLAEHMTHLAQNPRAALAMGQAGRLTARTCHLRPGSDGVWSILRTTLRTSARDDRASGGATPA